MRSKSKEAAYKTQRRKFYQSTNNFYICDIQGANREQGKTKSVCDTSYCHPFTLARICVSGQMKGLGSMQA